MRRLLHLLVVLAAGASASIAQAEPPQNVNPRLASGDPIVVIGSEVITDRFHVIGNPLSLAAVGSFLRHADVRTTLTVYSGLVETNRAGLRGDLETAFGAAR